MQKKILIITGPTAVGKTKYSVKTAKKINGEIISADSMQIYKYMNIGTAKPSFKERKGIKHHLISIIAPDGEFNVAKFVQMVYKKINKIEKKGKTPIIVGGTGLYLKALLYGFKFPGIGHEEKLRQVFKKEAQKYGIKFLYNKLMKVDPKKAKCLHPNDEYRIIRALEVYYNTGKPLSSQQFYNIKTLKQFKVICLMMDRGELYQLIDRRVEAMINKGLIKEVEGLIKRGYNSNLPALKAIGYKEIIEYLNGVYDCKEMIRLIKRNSRRLAKRQLTWFRSFPDIIFKEVKPLDFVKDKEEQ